MKQICFCIILKTLLRGNLFHKHFSTKNFSRHTPVPLVAQTFAKLGHSIVSEVDLNSWATSSLEENNVALTRRLAEVFFRQANITKDIRALVSNNEKLAKDARYWKQKAEACDAEMMKMSTTHQKHVEDATSKLHAELNEARKKAIKVEEARSNDLDKHVSFVSNLQTRIASLETNANKAAKEYRSALKDAEVLGQVKYMKVFMKKVPNFDWAILGEATKSYAAGLRKEMEEEAARRAADARRLAEEAQKNDNDVA